MFFLHKQCLSSTQFNLNFDCFILLLLLVTGKINTATQYPNKCQAMLKSVLRAALRISLKTRYFTNCFSLSSEKSNICSKESGMETNVSRTVLSLLSDINMLSQ